MDSREAKESEIESLVAALQDRNGMTRKHARERLVTLGPLATASLLPLLSDQEPQTRWEAAKALSEIADPGSIPALLQALKDEESDVNWLAAEALAAMGAQAAIPLLQALVEDAGSVKLRQGAHHTLRELRHSGIEDEIADVYSALSSMDADVEVIAKAERALSSLRSRG